MLAAGGIFTESMALDITVLGVIVAMFATIIGGIFALFRQKKATEADRIKEIKDIVANAVNGAINASPDKVVVAPQPLMVAIQETYVSKNEMKDMLRRLEILEVSSVQDKTAMLQMLADVPLRVIEMLQKTKGLL